MGRQTFLTRRSLETDLLSLGLSGGDMVMVHAAMSSIGPVLGGPDSVIEALLDAVGTTGTIIGYADWDASYEVLLEADGSVPARWRNHIPAFDAKASRAVRENGIFPEFLRTTPGALRSANPGASVVAIGGRAEWIVSGHPINYGYGPGSPLAKLIDAGGKVLMLGAPLDTVTLLHHAEHLADIPNKRIKRVEVPFRTGEGTEWRWVEEFDTSDAVAPQLDGRDYFTEIVENFLQSGRGVEGLVGEANCILADAAAILEFAVAWIERNGRKRQ